MTATATATATKTEHIYELISRLKNLPTILDKNEISQIPNRCEMSLSLLPLVCCSKLKMSRSFIQIDRHAKPQLGACA